MSFINYFTTINDNSTVHLKIYYYYFNFGNKISTFNYYYYCLNGTCFFSFNYFTTIIKKIQTIFQEKSIFSSRIWNY